MVEQWLHSSPSETVMEQRFQGLFGYIRAHGPIRAGLSIENAANADAKRLVRLPSTVSRSV